MLLFIGGSALGFWGEVLNVTMPDIGVGERVIQKEVTIELLLQVMLLERMQILHT